MATNVTSYGDISPRTAGFATKELLKRGQAQMVFERYGQIDPQGKKKTKTRKWRRYESLQRATAPLAEGITPKGQKVTYTDIEATLEQYGDLVEITDVIADTHEDPVLREMMAQVGEQAAETVELIRYGILRAGTNVFYANGVTSRSAVSSPATRGDFRKIERQLARNRARKISEIIGATAKISTEPVKSAYFAVGHTDLYADLQGVPGFIPVANYSDAMKAVPGEVGSIDHIRFVLTQLAEPWEAAGASGTTYLSNGVAPASSAAADVYPILIFARDAYAIVPLQGENAITPIVKNPNNPDKSDPLGQRGFVAWKTYQTAAILNQNWMARLEVAVTANPS